MFHSWFSDYVEPVSGGGLANGGRLLFFSRWNHYLVSCLKLFSAWLSVLNREAVVICSHELKLVWISELMEILFCHLGLKELVLFSFRGKHMHQSEHAVMWGVHPGLRIMWMVLVWSEFNHWSFHPSTLSYEWKIIQRSFNCGCGAFRAFSVVCMAVLLDGWIAQEQLAIIILCLEYCNL